MVSKYGELKTMRALLEQAANLSKIDRKELTEQLSPMLAPSPANHARRGGRSRLSHDGLPLQLRVCGESRERLELTIDPCWYIASSRERFEAAQRSLVGLARQCHGASEIEAALVRLNTRMSLVRGCCPEQADGGMLLIDYALRSKEIGFRIRLDHLDPITGWSLLQGWLQNVSPHAFKLARVVEELRATGFEIDRIGHRYRQAHGLVAIVQASRSRRAGSRQPHLDGLDMSAHTQLLSSVSSLQLYEDYKEHLALEIAPERGQLVGSRHELEPRDGANRWFNRFEEASPFPDTETFELQERQDSTHADVQRIGMEEDPSTRDIRTMLTFKPKGLSSPKKQSRREKRALIEERIRLAIHALIEKQGAEGCWIDYRLPFGYADCFSTAFIGLTMTRAVSFEPYAQEVAQRAAGWLATKRTREGGWGFGSHAGPDTRTSALTLRLFDEVGYARDPEDNAWLISMWDRRGGFISSRGPRHWSDVHPCVTALAWPALDEATKEKLEQGLHEYLAKFACADGKWHAYWWRTHHFSTYHHLYMLAEMEWLEEFPIEREATHLSANATTFEIAWALGAATLGGSSNERIDALLEELLERQQVDGSWLGSEDLRMTDPCCESPWEAPSGELYSDQHGCMTTASALWVLLDLVTQY